ncbi:MAG: hypothetical protein ACXW5U_28075 [Thermoanaerobaculia bacterium]
MRSAHRCGPAPEARGLAVPAGRPADLSLRAIDRVFHAVVLFGETMFSPRDAVDCWKEAFDRFLDRIFPLAGHMFVLAVHIDLLAGHMFVLARHIFLLSGHFDLLPGHFDLMPDRIDLFADQIALLRAEPVAFRLLMLLFRAS